MNMSPARMSAYTSRLDGLGQDFFDYLDATDPTAPFATQPDVGGGLDTGPTVSPTTPASSIPSSATGAFDWREVLERTGETLATGAESAVQSLVTRNLPVQAAPRPAPAQPAPRAAKPLLSGGAWLALAAAGMFLMRRARR